jgi:hypothetical protein
MKRILYTIGCLVVLPAAVVAQTPQQGWAAKLFKDGLAHDFGNVPLGAKLNHKFTLTNIYNVPLSVVSRASCGCVTPKQLTQAVQPRETVELEVEMDTTRIPGQFYNRKKEVTVTVTVSSGVQFRSEAYLNVAAVARTDVRLSPMSQFTFGIVGQGQTPTQTITVDYVGPLAWQITGVVQNNIPVDVRVVQVARQVGLVRYQIQATLQATAAAGDLRREIQLQTNDQVSPLLIIPVEATIKAPLEAVPNQVSLGTIKAGEVVTRRVVIRGNSSPFKIEKVTGDGNGLAVKSLPNAAPVQVVTIEIQPAKAGPLKASLVLTSSLNGATVTIEVEGNVVD